jgi:hypothetical protein
MSYERQNVYYKPHNKIFWRSFNELPTFPAVSVLDELSKILKIGFEEYSRLVFHFWITVEWPQTVLNCNRLGLLPKLLSIIQSIECEIV